MEKVLVSKLLYSLGVSEVFDRFAMDRLFCSHLPGT